MEDINTTMFVQENFTDIKREKYIYQYDLERTHSFSSLKASISAKATVKRAIVDFNDEQMIVLSVCWGKPHFFILNTAKKNVLWIEGTANESLEFTHLFTVSTSLAKWLKLMQKLAANRILQKWAENGEYLKTSDALKKFKS